MNYSRIRMYMGFTIGSVVGTLLVLILPSQALLWASILVIAAAIMLATLLVG